MPTGYHKNPAQDISRTEQMISGLKRQALSIRDNQIESDYQAIEYDIYDRVKYEKAVKYVNI